MRDGGVRVRLRVHRIRDVGVLLVDGILLRRDDLGGRDVHRGRVIILFGRWRPLLLDAVGLEHVDRQALELVKLLWYLAVIIRRLELGCHILGRIRTGSAGRA